MKRKLVILNYLNKRINMAIVLPIATHNFYYLVLYNNMLFYPFTYVSILRTVSKPTFPVSPFFRKAFTLPGFRFSAL